MKEAIVYLANPCVGPPRLSELDLSRFVSDAKLWALGRKVQLRMPCPECLSVSEDFLIFRNAVYRFARTLGQLEAERLRVLNQNLPEGVPPIGSLAALIAKEAGYSEPP